MQTINLKASHKIVKSYYDELNSLSNLGISHEGAVSPAFADLLKYCANQFKQTLVEKYSFKSNNHNLIADGAIVDAFNLVHGYWEAKDTADDLDKEIKKKLEIGYPKNNILFQAPNRIVIFQDNQKVFDEDVVNPEHLIEGLKVFFEYQPPAFKQWEKAVEEFKYKVKELAAGVLGLIEKERKTNLKFIQAFDDFVLLCKETLNPNISTEAVEEMLIQHLLTERIFRKVFNNPDFVERNVIAHEIEKVISALTSHYFSRNEFLQPLDHFYVAIENTAATIQDFSEKQSFLNSVYENFFQGFSVKIADTHGIVYTPQPIVKFMVKSVGYILQKEFNRSISDEGIHFIDPFVGTGNFILWIMREMQKSKLPFKYSNEIHCNEVMLLPYYIASMNIEHEYFSLVGEYKPFDGICLVDTFDLYKIKQISMFTKENTVRVKRQQNSPIFVVIGNPPYNAGQVNENDNNKNRKYEEMDTRVFSTYGLNSRATLLRKLNDPYIKAIRWATDRIKDDGIVALVTNNSFVNEITFDGMRKCLEKEYDSIYILDLGGNVRKNPKLSGTTHNVFGIQIGVSINIFVKRKKGQPDKKAKIYYQNVDEFWRKEQKYDFLDTKGDIFNIKFEQIQPDLKCNWLTKGMMPEFETFLSLGTKENKTSTQSDTKVIFKTYSLGVSTNRDKIVYDFDSLSLEKRIERFCDDYNAEVHRYQQKGNPKDIDNFIDYDKIKWSSTLKNHLSSGTFAVFDKSKILDSFYRPFTRMNLYYDHVLIDRPGHFKKIFPKDYSDNLVICVPSVGGRTNFWSFCVNLIPNLTLMSIDANQCFPFYIYSEDGTNRQENIVDSALFQFQSNYNDNSITKLDIFYYIYAVLHHIQYREKYASNLKREVPRIPFAPDFWSFVKAGKKLVDLHINYENQPEYKLTWIEDPDAKLNYRVERLILSKDKSRIIFNEFLTLTNIPPEVFEYRLGNRSALEWIIDQYQVNTDKRTGITNDPNRLLDPEYIVHLIGKVITVSLETLKIIKSLPDFE